MAGKTVNQKLEQALRDLNHSEEYIEETLRPEIRELKEDRTELRERSKQLRNDLTEARRELREKELKVAEQRGYMDRCQDLDRLRLIEKGKIKPDQRSNHPPGERYGYGVETSGDWRYR